MPGLKFRADFACPHDSHFLTVPLKKQWAAKLEALCLETADERTCLEATSYSAWMSGNLLLEKEEWREALDRYSTAHRICQELGKVAGLATVDLLSFLVLSWVENGRCARLRLVVYALDFPPCVRGEI